VAQALSAALYHFVAQARAGYLALHSNGLGRGGFP